MVDEVIAAAEANRQFSRILREVAAGHRFLVTARGRPVARIVPADPDDAARVAAREALLRHLDEQPTQNIGHWTRDELYE